MPLSEGSSVWGLGGASAGRLKGLLGREEVEAPAGSLGFGPGGVNGKARMEPPQEPSAVVPRGMLEHFLEESIQNRAHLRPGPQPELPHHVVSVHREVADGERV